MEFTAALLAAGDSAFSFQKVSLGRIAPHEVLVRLVASGICHTDLTVRDGVFSVLRPIVLGHEGSGIVERVGASVSKFRAGDPVALTFMSCGVCQSCKSAAPAYCSQFGPLNMSGFRADGSSALSLSQAPVGGHFFG